MNKLSSQAALPKWDAVVFRFAEQELRICTESEASSCFFRKFRLKKSEQPASRMVAVAWGIYYRFCSLEGIG